VQSFFRLTSTFKGSSLVFISLNADCATALGLVSQWLFFSMPALAQHLGEIELLLQASMENLAESWVAQIWTLSVLKRAHHNLFLP
jgi:hypothetical protein